MTAASIIVSGYVRTLLASTYHKPTADRLFTALLNPRGGRAWVPLGDQACLRNESGAFVLYRRDE